MTAGFMWTAMRWRNYRIYIAGQTVSLVGSFMQMVGISWLVYRLTQSEIALGFYSFLTELSSVAVVLFAGVLADRTNPQNILLSTQILAMLQAFALSVLVFTGRIDIVSVFAFGCFLGLVNGFDAPARHALLPSMVEDQSDFRNAIALYSLALDAARLVGPALAGMLIASWGEGMCFLANGVSYMVVIISLLSLRLKPLQRISVHDNMVRSLSAGIRYVYGHRSIRAVILLVVCVSFGGSSVAVLMPFMAVGVLKGGPQTLGILLASTSLGAHAGAFFLGMKGDADGLKHQMGVGACLYGFGTAAFSQSTWLVLSAALLSVAGFGIMIMMASGNTILLSEVEADKRGRVMSLFTLSFMGTVPFGSLCAGILAKLIGSQATIALGAGVCIFGALLFILVCCRPMPSKQ